MVSHNGAPFFVSRHAPAEADFITLHHTCDIRVPEQANNIEYVVSLKVWKNYCSSEGNEKWRRRNDLEEENSDDCFNDCRLPTHLLLLGSSSRSSSSLSKKTTAIFVRKNIHVDFIFSLQSLIEGFRRWISFFSSAIRSK